MSKQTRILHIIDSLNVGGTEKQCVETVIRVNNAQYAMHLVTLNKTGPLYGDLMDAGVPVTEFKIAGGFYRPESLLQIFRLASFMREKKFDVVQTYGFFSTVPGVIAAKIAGVRAIIAGKRDMNELLERPKIMVEKFLWRFCDKIVVNAKKIGDYLVDHEGVPGEKIALIYNGVDLERFSMGSEKGVYQTKPDTIGMIANFREQKDHRTFLKACAEVLKTRENVTFALIGSGPLEDKMKHYAGQLGIEDHTVFHGRKTGKALSDVVKSLTISVLSSSNEGIPNTLLESMAFEIPVIANPSGGVPELVEEGVTGFLFPYKDVSSLSEKMLYLMDHKKVAEDFGKRGRTKVEQMFQYHLMCRKYENLYEKVCCR